MTQTYGLSLTTRETWGLDNKGRAGVNPHLRKVAKEYARDLLDLVFWATLLRAPARAMSRAKDTTSPSAEMRPRPQAVQEQQPRATPDLQYLVLQARTDSPWPLDEADLNMSHRALIKYLSHKKLGLEYEVILYTITIAVPSCHAFLTGHGSIYIPVFTD